MGLVLFVGFSTLHSRLDSLWFEVLFSSRSVVEVGLLDTSVIENSTRPSLSAWEKGWSIAAYIIIVGSYLDLASRFNINRLTVEYLTVSR